jgi:hypothetical protein
MLHSGIVQGDNAMDIAFIFSWRTQCSSGAAPHPLGFTQRLDLGVRDGMSSTKRVIESGIIRSSVAMFYGVRRDSIPIGIEVSKSENADELARNAVRWRRFFFTTGNG